MSKSIGATRLGGMIRASAGGFTSTAPGREHAYDVTLCLGGVGGGPLAFGGFPIVHTSFRCMLRGIL